MAGGGQLFVLLISSAEFEAGFIRLLDKLTNGSRIEVNETGATEWSNMQGRGRGWSLLIDNS